MKLTLGDAITASAGGAYDFAENASEVDYAKTSGNQTLYGTTYGLLTLSGASTFSLSGDVTAGNTVSHTGGALTVDNNFTANAGYSFNEIATISATKALTLGTTGSITTLTDIAATGQLVNGTGLLTVATLSDNNGTITALANDGAMTFTNAATNSRDIVGGDGLVLFSSTLSTSGDIDAGPGSVRFNGVLTNTGTVFADAGASLDFNANVDNTGGTIQLDNTGSATFAASFLASGELTLASTSTWTYDGAGAQDVAGGGTVTYGNLNIDGGGGLKSALAAITVAGNLDNGGTGNDPVTFDLSTFALSITGTRDNTGATIRFGGETNGQFFNTGTVEYDGTAGEAAGGQTIALSGGADQYNSLVFTNDAVKSITGGIVRTNSGLTVNSGVPVTVSATGDLRILSGDLSNAGAITNNGSITVGN